MNKFLGILLFVISIVSLEQIIAQSSGFSFNKPVDEMNFVLDTVDRSDRIYVWSITQDGSKQREDMDTASLNFYTYNPIFKSSIANNYLGNLGSPYESMIYFDRPRDLQFGMADVYRDYLYLPEDIRYMNTKTAYSNVQYTSGGPKRYREESLQVSLSRNVNKDWNVGMFGNLYFGRGRYSYQSTRHVNFTFYTSYEKPRYQLYFVGNENNLANKENGGIANDEFITNPDLGNGQVTNPEDFTTNFLDGVTSYLYNTNIFLKHKYNLGYEKEVGIDEDSTIMEFVPLSSIVHTFQWSNYIKQYVEATDQNHGMYPENILMDKRIQDRLSTRNISNEIGLYLNEGVNKYTIFGAGAYIGNEIIRVENDPWRTFRSSMDTMGHQEAVDYYSDKTPSMVMDSSTYEFARAYSPYNYSNTKIGATVFKRQGESFFFNLKGELFIEGYRSADYLLYGDVQLRLQKLDSVYFKGTAEIGGRTPYYYQNTYYANNFWWDKQLKKVNNQKFTGELNFPKWRTTARFKLENIFEYVYFDSLGSVQQDPNVQVLAVDLLKDFTFGNWHWDNTLTYQASSSPSIAVPDLAIYTNFYYLKQLFGVLTMQTGFDVRYTTAFYAPKYLPATGRFVQQTEKKIGDYPFINAYANFHLKRMRFFVKVYHVNKGFLKYNYFTSPSYPANPRMFTVGLSWNFYQ